MIWGFFIYLLLHGDFVVFVSVVFIVYNEFLCGFSFMNSVMEAIMTSLLMYDSIVGRLYLEKKNEIRSIAIKWNSMHSN